MWSNLYTIDNIGFFSVDIIGIVLLSIILIPIMLRMSEVINISKRRIVFILIPIEIVMVIFTIVVISSRLSDRQNTVDKYQNGEYKIIEGYVNHFKEDCDDYRDNDECFDINGVFFAYRDMSTRMGYHKTRKNGGVIKGNNQYLRIYYVYAETEIVGEYTNVILRIDELKE